MSWQSFVKGLQNLCSPDNRAFGYDPGNWNEHLTTVNFEELQLIVRRPWERYWGTLRRQTKNDVYTKDWTLPTLRGKVQKQTFPLNLQIPQTARDSHFSTASTTADF